MEFSYNSCLRESLDSPCGNKYYQNGPQAEVNSLLMKIPQMGKKVDNDKIFSRFYKFKR